MSSTRTSGLISLRMVRNRYQYMIFVDGSDRCSAVIDIHLNLLPMQSCESHCVYVSSQRPVSEDDDSGSQEAHHYG